MKVLNLMSLVQKLFKKNFDFLLLKSFWLCVFFFSKIIHKQKKEPFQWTQYPPYLLIQQHHVHKMSDRRHHLKLFANRLKLATIDVEPVYPLLHFFVLSGN